MTDARCAELAAWLKLESLRELNLTYNRRITSSGVKSIAKSLPAGSRLQSLDLASTSCGNEGLLALVAAFSKHERPPTVDLSATNVTAAVFSDEDAIASSLRVNLEWCHGVSSNIRFPCALSQACAQHRSSE